MPADVLGCSVSALRLGYGNDVDKLASVAAFRELNSAAYEGVESVVFADAYVEAGVVLCAALALDDVACFSELTTKDFYTESFAF